MTVAPPVHTLAPDVADVPPAATGVTHVLTGVTGFIGAAMALELLRRTGDQLVALVRPGERGADDRFRRAMADAAAAYEVDPVDLSRCRVVSGDLRLPECGVTEDLGGGRLVFWHCAASLRYEDRYADEIVATNVEGTRNALALAERLGAERFNYISTAYVAGKASGVIPEAPVDQVETNNCYEHSKVEAERLVGAATAFRTRILRPSIIIGHGRTKAATTFSGFYGFLRQLVQLRGMLDRAQEGLGERTVLRMRVDPDARVNLAPVDAAAEELVRLGLADGPDGVFHVTHPAPPAAGGIIRQMCRAAGLAEPLFVTDTRDFTWLDEKLDTRIGFYRSYLVGDKQFQRARTDRALAGAPAPVLTLDEATVDAYIGWYLTRLAAERAHLPAAR